MTWRPPRKPNSEIDATPLAISLEVVAAKVGAAPPRTVKAVFDQWHDTVGSEIAGHARPLSLVDGALVVAVDDQRWVTQLKWMAFQLVERLNEASGTNFIERMEVRFEPPRSPS